MGKTILTNKYTYYFAEPKRGDIVIFPFPQKPDRLFIKRVVAVGRDKIEIRNKIFYLNDKEVKEEFIIFEDSEIGDDVRDNFGPFTVPDNSLFVLGDNRDQSYDSRFWGVVDISTVLGKAQLIYWSWNKGNNSVRWNRIGKTIK